MSTHRRAGSPMPQSTYGNAFDRAYTYNVVADSPDGQDTLEALLQGLGDLHVTRQPEPVVHHNVPGTIAYSVPSTTSESENKPPISVNQKDAMDALPEAPAKPALRKLSKTRIPVPRTVALTRAAAKTNTTAKPVVEQPKINTSTKTVKTAAKPNPKPPVDNKPVRKAAPVVSLRQHTAPAALPTRVPASKPSVAASQRTLTRKKSTIERAKPLPTANGHSKSVTSKSVTNERSNPAAAKPVHTNKLSKSATTRSTAKPASQIKLMKARPAPTTDVSEPVTKQAIETNIANQVPQPAHDNPPPIVDYDAFVESICSKPVSRPRPSRSYEVPEIPPPPPRVFYPPPAAAAPSPRQFEVYKDPQLVFRPRPRTWSSPVPMPAPRRPYGQPEEEEEVARVQEQEQETSMMSDGSPLANVFQFLAEQGHEQDWTPSPLAASHSISLSAAPAIRIDIERLDADDVFDTLDMMPPRGRQNVFAGLSPESDHGDLTRDMPQTPSRRAGQPSSAIQRGILF
ncbi:hypothetical protein CYLTODRAFT_446963 [Cylindrobasidium torrendii FP15055 ss-10]|uniref:Uncharacterized protein n=1 Tax=Cylindrobasidium torrendii FP15055 ss-10 TaxID=1314674 RepID=A0A0D7AWW1_9AGAR|nr:hypothetical protein CYLTODRAFT_446963 [Cylindrobasidium torrendii FP15055 ss-10]